MTLRQYLSLMSIATFLCWMAWITVVWYSDPTRANFMGLFLFYFSLFLSIIGTFSVCGFLIQRAIIKNDYLVFRHVKKTFRQGFLTASFVIICLLLLAKDLLAWWNFIILIVLFIFLEMIIFTGRKFQNLDYV